MRAERFEALGHRRDIIDRRALAAQLAGDPGKASERLRDALEQGRAVIAARLAEAPSEGREAAAATCFLHEQLVRAGVHVGALVVNKRSPADAGDFLAERRALEEVHVATLRGALPGVPLLQVPLLPGDVVGQEALERFGDALAQADLRAT